MASNRVDVKQAAARAERALERLAEPLSALFAGDDGRDHAAALGLAWTEVVRNAAHDSVCACSADDVVAAVLTRYAEATQIAEAVTARALAALGESMAVKAPVVVNPSPHTRSGLVELVLPGTGDIEGGQVVAARAGSATERVVTGGQLGILLGQVANDEAVWGGAIVGVDVADDESGLDVVLRTGPRPPVPDPALASTIAGLYARAGARRRDPIHVRIEHEPYRRVLVRADDVAGFGWKAWSPSDPPSAVAPVTATRNPDDGFTLANGLLTVTVDPADGTFADRRAEGPRPPRRRRRRRRHLQLLAPRRRHRGRRPHVGRRRHPRARAAAGQPPGRAHLRVARAPRGGQGTGRRPHRSRCRPGSSCGPANAWSGSPPASTTPAATTACGPGSPSPPRPPRPGPSAPSAPSSGACWPRAEPPSGACRRSRPAGS